MKVFFFISLQCKLHIRTHFETNIVLCGLHTHTHTLCIPHCGSVRRGDFVAWMHTPRAAMFECKNLISKRHYNKFFYYK